MKSDIAALEKHFIDTSDSVVQIGNKLHAEFIEEIEMRVFGRIPVRMRRYVAGIKEVEQEITDMQMTIIGLKAKREEVSREAAPFTEKAEEIGIKIRESAESFCKERESTNKKFAMFQQQALSLKSQIEALHEEQLSAAKNIANLRALLEKKEFHSKYFQVAADSIQDSFSLLNADLDYDDKASRRGSERDRTAEQIRSKRKIIEAESVKLQSRHTEVKDQIKKIIDDNNKLKNVEEQLMKKVVEYDEKIRKEEGLSGEETQRAENRELIQKAGVLENLLPGSRLSCQLYALNQLREESALSAEIDCVSEKMKEIRNQIDSYEKTNSELGDEASNISQKMENEARIQKVIFHIQRSNKCKKADNSELRSSTELLRSLIDEKSGQISALHSQISIQKKILASLENAMRSPSNSNQISRMNALLNVLSSQTMKWQRTFSTKGAEETLNSWLKILDGVEAAT